MYCSDEFGFGFLNGSGVDFPVIHARIRLYNTLAHLAYAASGHKRHVRRGKQFLYVLHRQRTSVQSDFSHLHGPAFQDSQYLVYGLILYCSTNHYLQSFQPTKIVIFSPIILLRHISTSVNVVLPEVFMV